MKNHKQLLMDFYLNLLSIPHSSTFRIRNQALYAAVLGTLAMELDADPEELQNIFERMVQEDSR